MNALPAWLRSGNSDLRPTPTIPPSYATLEALHTISPLAFHSVFPTLENFTKLWERPGAYDLIDNSLLYKVNRQEWEEWMYMEESDTSSPTVDSFVKVLEPLPSLPTEEISSIERVRRWLATYQPSPLQNWLATPPTPPSSDAPDDAPTTSHVQDRAEGQQAIGRALVSIQKRRPEAWREANQGVERREKVTNIMKTCMQRRGSH